MIRGLAELNAALADLGTDIATKIGQSADRAGAVVLQQAAMAAAPKSDIEEGAMIGGKPHHKIANSIKVKKTQNETPTRVQTTVYTKVPQAMWTEFGSIHNQPQRWMTKAVENASADAVNKIAAILEKRITKGK